MRLKRISTLEWDAIAGVIAAVAAIVLDLLKLINPQILLTITVVLIALLFLRDIRREQTSERLENRIADLRSAIREMEIGLMPPDAILIGPNRIRAASHEFMSHAKGEMIWFHVCLSMFKPQTLFNNLLRPAIENPAITSIRFILDENQQPLWHSEVLPKVRDCIGAAKVLDPQWTHIRESISMIVAESTTTGRTECLLSFWGEPFMARSAARDVPRYIFHIQGHSELIHRLLEIQRDYRLSAVTKE